MTKSATKKQLRKAIEVAREIPRSPAGLIERTRKILEDQNLEADGETIANQVAETAKADRDELDPKPGRRA